MHRAALQQRAKQRSPRLVRVAQLLTARLQRLLKPGEDRLSLLPLCADCQRRLVRLGTDAPTPHRPGGDTGCTHGLGSSGAFKPYLVI